uniref:Uncharacterized protein n=1 Tax=Eutreptiella gymnastica TaxID=73025 RepID=A0A7S4LIW9_9EUGL
MGKINPNFAFSFCPVHRAVMATPFWCGVGGEGPEIRPHITFAWKSRFFFFAMLRWKPFSSSTEKALQGAVQQLQQTVLQEVQCQVLCRFPASSTCGRFIQIPVDHY